MAAGKASDGACICETDEEEEQIDDILGTTETGEEEEQIDDILGTTETGDYSLLYFLYFTFHRLQECAWRDVMEEAADEAMQSD